MEDSDRHRATKITVLCSIITGAFAGLLAIICLLYNGSMSDLREQNKLLRKQNDEIRVGIHALSIATDRIVSKTEDVVRVADRVGRPLGIKMGIGGGNPYGFGKKSR